MVYAKDSFLLYSFELNGVEITRYAIIFPYKEN